MSKGVVQEAEIEALLDALVLKVDEFSYRTTSEHLRIRYLLARVNSYVQRSFNVTQHTVDNLLVTKTPTNQSGYDIDHIFPKSQSRREFWAVSQEMNTRFGEQDRSSRALNAIGNLSLLRGVDNQFSSDDLPWTEEKLSSYATSELIICQLLSPSGLASIANHKPNEQPLADLGWPKGLSLNEWGEEQSLELRNFYAQTMRRSIANDLDHPE